MIFYLIADSIKVRTSSVNATLGETFTFIIEEVVKEKLTLSLIEYGSNTCYMRLYFRYPHRCMFERCPFIIVECDSSYHEITLTIPGQHMIENFHGTQWAITSKRKILEMKTLYVNGM